MLEDIRERINRYLIHETDFLRVKDKMNEDELRRFVDKSIRELCDYHNVHLTGDEIATLTRVLVSAVTSLGPLRPLMEDKDITEIMINGSKRIYVQKHGKIELTYVKFE